MKRNALSTSIGSILCACVFALSFSSSSYAGNGKHLVNCTLKYRITGPFGPVFLSMENIFYRHANHFQQCQPA